MPRVRCPDCGALVELAPDVSPGDLVECPHCAGQALRVRREGDRWTTSLAHRVSCPDCDAVITLPEGARAGDTVSCCGRRYRLSLAYGAFRRGEGRPRSPPLIDWPDGAALTMMSVGVATSRQLLERYQVAFYVGAALLGLGLGTAAPSIAPGLDTLLWPVLALLLYVTFVQVPVARLPSAFREGRFLAAILIGNFVVVPPVVWGLSRLLAGDPAILLGTLMVLLVPCTDWFITFTQLGRGDARLAIAATPVNLLAQMVFLPAYLWLFADQAFVGSVEPWQLLGAFLGLIVLPLVLATGTQRWTERDPGRQKWGSRMHRMPVPLLAVVVFLIAASRAGTVVESLPALGAVALVFVAYLLVAAWLGLATGKVFGLPPPATRTLIFSLGTRNSFVVLPFALALPPGWDAAAVVIVLQSLVELFGMMGYLWWVPRRLVPEGQPYG